MPTLDALLVFVHVLCAAVWVGGHLVLALRILPTALRAGDTAALARFEALYEPLAAPSLLLLALTGLALAGLHQPEGSAWFGFADAFSALVTAKLVLLAATIGLALHAKLRLGAITSANLGTYAWHARAVTVLAVLLLANGVGLRLL
jgi:putative copper export protein